MILIFLLLHKPTSSLHCIVLKGKRKRLSKLENTGWSDLDSEKSQPTSESNESQGEEGNGKQKVIAKATIISTTGEYLLSFPSTQKVCFPSTQKVSAFLPLRKCLLSFFSTQKVVCFLSFPLRKSFAFDKTF